MRRLLRFGFSALTIAAVLVACGARTGLQEDPPRLDASADATLDAQTEASLDARADATLDATLDASFDAPSDSPLFEGGELDAKPECTAPAYCDPLDRGFIYRCGVRIFQCSSIEQ